MAENEKLIMRADRKMFMGVKSTSGSSSTETIYRMKGFSSLSENKNPSEYTRKYVDELHDTTDVTGMSSSYDFTFDLISPNEVLTDLAEIIDSEKIGDDTVRTFYCVDFHKPVSAGGFECTKRDFSVVGSTVGDGTDALTYSGTLKVKSSAVKGIATISQPATGGDKENVQQITFTASDSE